MYYRCVAGLCVVGTLFAFELKQLLSEETQSLSFISVTICGIMFVATILMAYLAVKKLTD